MERPLTPGRDEKTVEMPESTGNLLRREAMTPSARTAGAAVMLLAIFYSRIRD
jgi:hypothetical protein